MKGLLRYFYMTTRELAAELDKTASVHGAESWLFLPENPKGRVCLVAHIDTVFDEHDQVDKKHNCLMKNPPKPRKKRIFFDEKKSVLWSPDGLGGDDRAGVWACLEAFKNTPEPFKPIVLLTDGEETGGTGAHEAVELFGDILKEAAFLVELDRRGKNEAVFYNLEPGEFIDHIASFGFRESMGSFSDISIICPQVGRCGVNLSVGYHNAHSKAEFQNTQHLKHTVDILPKILESNHKNPTDWELDTFYGDFDEEFVPCPRCGEMLGQWDIEESWACPFCGEDLMTLKEEHAEAKRELHTWGWSYSGDHDCL